jgi:hypothetical protein
MRPWFDQRLARSFGQGRTSIFSVSTLTSGPTCVRPLSTAEPMCPFGVGNSAGSVILSDHSLPCLSAAETSTRTGSLKIQSSAWLILWYNQNSEGILDLDLFLCPPPPPSPPAHIATSPCSPFGLWLAALVLVEASRHFTPKPFPHNTC